MGKGEDLNFRVWKLFENAGFETNPNSADTKEHQVSLPHGKTRPVDLYAREAELAISIIGSNKARKKLKSFTEHMHDLEELVQAQRASCGLFVAAEKEMLDNERDYAKQRGIQVWDEAELSYYEAIVEALGRFAKYEIIYSLGLTTAEEALKDTVIGIRLEQPRSSSPTKTEMYMFTLPAEKLLKMAVVLRKAQGSAFAYQRILAKKRLPKIGTFLGTPSAVVPTNIIVHLSDDVSVDEIPHDLKDATGKKVLVARQDHKLVALTFPLRYGSVELIDGQHRLFGFVHASAATRKNFNLVVLGMRRLDEKRRSDTFIAINDNARRVDPNLVAYLRYTDDEKVCQQVADLMAIKIVVELNKLSPFKGQIRLFDFGKNRLTLKGLSGYDLRGLVGPKGTFRRLYPRNKSKTYILVLRKYFSVIKEQFNTEWNDPASYIIATNRGITAFLKLLRSILAFENRPLTKAISRKYVSALAKNWKGTWQTSNLKKSYVGSQGWKQFHSDMVAAIQKQYKTFH
jgi:DNA sulfur modification protein DndB